MKPPATFFCAVLIMKFFFLFQIFNQFEKVTGAERENELMKFISLKLADLGCNLVIMGDNVKDEKEMNFINDLKNKDVNVKYSSVSGGNLQEINRIYQSLVTEYGCIDLLVSFCEIGLTCFCIIPMSRIAQVG